MSIIHGSRMSTKAIVICVVDTSTKGGPLLDRSICLQEGLKIIKSNVIDAITLLLGTIFFPEEVLLSMAGNLHWGLGGNKVPRDVLPISVTVHM